MLVHTGLISSLSMYGYDVSFRSSDPRGIQNPEFINPHNKFANSFKLGESCRRMAETITKVQKKKENEIILNILGDHSGYAGSAAGFLNAHATAAMPVHFFCDAHADINDWRTSGSGHSHGMPIRFHIDEEIRS